MAEIRAYTTIEQSRKLTEILSIESADMCYINGDSGKISIGEWGNNVHDEDDLPCWSLAALLEQLPYELCDDDGNSVYLEINKEDDLYQLVYTDPYENFENVETDRCEHFVDACCEMVLKLHELNLL